MKIRVAIFGSGQMAKIYAEILSRHDYAQLVGFVGNGANKTELLKSDYGVPAYGNGSYKEFLKDFEVDAVIIATPEWVRLEPIKAVVNAGKSLLLEKPMAENWNDAKSIYSALLGYSKVIQFCHVLRFSPRFYALKQMVDAGRVGEIRHMHGCRNSNNKRVERVLGKADLAFWLTPHDIDIMRWLTGSEVDSVYTVSRGQLNTSDDYIVSLLRFQNNVTATHEVSWCTPPLSTSAREAFFEVRGVAGAIELDDFANNVRLFTQNDSVFTPDTYEHFSIQNQYHGFFRIMLDEFINRVRLKLNSPIDLEDAMETMRVCEMISRSVRLGREVKRSEVK
jgi:predicted dehydrogenase